MASYGRIEEFSAEHIELPGACRNFFHANRIADGKKVPVFLSIAGGSVYTLLRSLLSPVKPQEKTFDELKVELKKHFQPKRSSSPSVSTSTEETRHQTRASPSM